MYLLVRVFKDTKGHLLYCTKIKESKEKEVVLSNLEMKIIENKFEHKYGVSAYSVLR